MPLFAIDPGCEKSAYCLVSIKGFKPIIHGIVPNGELMDIIKGIDLGELDRAAIEMLQNLGMGAVGQEVFDTAFWVGRFYEAFQRKGVPTRLVYRKDEKIHICGTHRAKDANIRQALIDRFAPHERNGGRGTKGCPGWFYGFHDDIWSAYAVAITDTEYKR